MLHRVKGSVFFMGLKGVVRKLSWGQSFFTGYGNGGGGQWLSVMLMGQEFSFNNSQMLSQYQLKLVKIHSSCENNLKIKIVHGDIVLLKCTL